MTVNRLMRTPEGAGGNEIMGISWFPLPCFALAPLLSSPRRRPCILRTYNVSFGERPSWKARRCHLHGKWTQEDWFSFIAGVTRQRCVSTRFNAVRREAGCHFIYASPKKTPRSRTRARDNERLMKRTWWMRRGRGELITRSGRAFVFKEWLMW